MNKKGIIAGILILCASFVSADVKTEKILIDNLHDLEILFDTEKNEVEIKVYSDKSVTFDESYVNNVIDDNLNDFMNEYNFSSFSLLTSKMDEEKSDSVILIKKYVVD